MSYIGNQPVLNTSEFREEFAVTSTQTVFNTGGFTASSDSATLEILRNGVLLGTADYTLGSDASTVTLANAAVNGDIIVIKGRRELTNGVQVTERRHEHTIASGETTVTFPYPLTVSQTDVYLNGVKLGSSDFSINSSTRVVSFTTNPAVGDLVAIVSREPALTANSSLPVVDAAGTNVLSESGGVVTLTADEANVGSNALVVNSSGNVGVGTSPSTKLDISDTSRLTVNVSNAYVLETSLNSTGSAFASHYENASDHIFQTSGTERMRIDSSGNLNLNGGGEYQKSGTTGRIITYGDVTVGGLTTNYQNIKITLPNSITHNQVVSIIPQQGVINDIVYIADIALGVWSGVQTTNEARLTIKLGNAVASSDGIVRVWYIL